MLWRFWGDTGIGHADRSLPPLILDYVINRNVTPFVINEARRYEKTRHVAGFRLR